MTPFFHRRSWADDDDDDDPATKTTSETTDESLAAAASTPKSLFGFLSLRLFFSANDLLLTMRFSGSSGGGGVWRRVKKGCLTPCYP